MAALETPVSTGSMTQAPSASVVGWGAIAAGAVATIATGIALMALGTGVGLSAASPWSGEGASAKAIGVGAVIWMVVMQWLSAALGGYLTGRLRLRWNYYDRDEVYFRDTAHGFLSWALAIALTVAFAGALATGVLGSATTAGATAAAQARNASNGYFTDSLFRTDVATTGAEGTAPAATGGASPAQGGNANNAEANRIMAQGLAGDFSQDDRSYLATLVARRTGMSQDAARQRVDQVVVKAKQAADTARKATAAMAIATALSLLVGAFVSAAAAGYGGRLRDE
jgi:hypothetical protein